MNAARPVSLADRVRAALLLLVFAAAPVAGDIGSCGQSAEDLDALKFFARKGGIDLTRCNDCGFETAICQNLRAGKLESTSFPDNCYPLVHDGEVCLDALMAADCEEYASFVADEGRTVPGECNFCPARGDAVADAGDAGDGDLLEAGP